MKKLADQIEEVKDEYRDVPRGQLYLERVEAAGMQVLTQCILEKDWPSAREALGIMQELSIV